MFLAKWFAKRQYVWRQSVEAETNDLHARLALRNAQEKRDLSAQLTKEADDMDARIKELDEKMEKGFWECEDGHERGDQCSCASATPGFDAIVHGDGCWREKRDFGVICECGKPMKLVKRDQMTGQEKYESDKERKDAEDLAKAKRAQAAAEEGEAQNSEKTARYFRDLATSNRNVADKIRRL